MSVITIIAAMTNNRIIGHNNTLPWNIPNEMQHFKQTTLGKPIIMGRSTYLSLPKKPLPDRDNWVVSKTLKHTPANVHVVPSLDAALHQLQNQPETMIIGGQQLYTEALAIADKMILSIIKQEYPGDCYFPDFDADLWYLDKEINYPEFDIKIYLHAQRMCRLSFKENQTNSTHHKHCCDKKK